MLTTRTENSDRVIGITTKGQQKKAKKLLKSSNVVI